MYRSSTVTSFLVLFLLIAVIVMPPNFTRLSAQKQEVKLSALLEDQGDPERWKSLILPSLQELRNRHPDLNIQLNYTTYPYNEMRESFCQQPRTKRKLI